MVRMRPFITLARIGKWFVFLACLGLATGAQCMSAQPETEPVDTSASALACTQPADMADIPGKRFTNSIGMTFIMIPAGEFDMGSPETEQGHPWKRDWPVHRVRITKPFWMCAFEVTQAQYKIVMGKNPSTTRKDPKFPVTDVNWEKAVEFCKRLSQREGRRYRLPTEAEWEFACRAGTTTEFFFGDSPDQLEEYAVTRPANPHAPTPLRVGSRKPNPWGLYDMVGNVDEWVLDIVEFDRSDLSGGVSPHMFDLPRYPSEMQIDPKGPPKGQGRVARGGAFDDGKWGVRAFRSAARVGFYPTGTDSRGFRVVCEEPAATTQAR